MLIIIVLDFQKFKRDFWRNNSFKLQTLEVVLFSSFLISCDVRLDAREELCAEGWREAEILKLRIDPAEMVRLFAGGQNCRMKSEGGKGVDKFWTPGPPQKISRTIMGFLSFVSREGLWLNRKIESFSQAWRPVEKSQKLKAKQKS